MRRNYKVLLLSLLLAFASCSFTTKKFSNPDKDKLLIQVITFVLEQGHFDPIALDDTFSAELFKDYLEIIDPVKRYFYESDYIKLPNICIVLFYLLITVIVCLNLVNNTFTWFCLKC